MSSAGRVEQSPPGAWKPLVRVVRRARRPLDHFLSIQAASGIVLLLSAAIALLWASSPWAHSYDALWHTPVGLRLGGFSFERTLEWVVNDGLMVIFFFLVGLEIRREIHQGELSEWRRAALPAAAAVGGMLAPAALYLALARQPELRSGWGVPMATDIAFALGVLTLLGKRVPAALRVQLLALAVIDDLGAILVIALFYSQGVALTGLLVAALGIAVVLLMQSIGVRTKALYIVPGLVIWGGIYRAGIHPTIAGVIIGLLTPVRPWVGHEEHSPAEQLIEMLHPWVAYGIMPVFALANAGVVIATDALDASSWQAITGVTFGLVVGKPLGILLAIWVMLRAKLGVLPVGLRLPHLIVLGMVAGIGFTMALFVAQLAFADQQLLAAAKVGVLGASALAAGLALGVGWIVLSPLPTPGAAETADEAERSTEL